MDWYDASFSTEQRGARPTSSVHRALYGGRPVLSASPQSSLSVIELPSAEIMYHALLRFTGCCLPLLLASCMGSECVTPSTTSTDDTHSQPPAHHQQQALDAALHTATDDAMTQLQLQRRTAQAILSRLEIQHASFEVPAATPLSRGRVVLSVVNRTGLTVSSVLIKADILTPESPYPWIAGIGYTTVDGDLQPGAAATLEFLILEWDAASLQDLPDDHRLAVQVVGMYDADDLPLAQLPGISAAPPSSS